MASAAAGARRAWRGWTALVAGLLVLSGCATQPPRAVLPVVADPGAHQQAREQALAAAADWGLEGRVAVSNGRNGGSGRLDWRQQGVRYEVSLSAPVTRQSWRLSGQPGQALLEGLEDGPRQGSDAAGLLQEATRWQIPVEALASWMRGMRAEADRFGEASLEFGRDGRLARMQQGGWVVEYGDWRRVAGAPVELPHRLSAVRGEARVRLVVDRWQ